MSGIFTVNGLTYGDPCGEWADLDTLEAYRDAERLVEDSNDSGILDASGVVIEWARVGEHIWHRCTANVWPDYLSVADLVERLLVAGFKVRALTSEHSHYYRDEA